MNIIVSTEKPMTFPIKGLIGVIGDPSNGVGYFDDEKISKKEQKKSATEFMADRRKDFEEITSFGVKRVILRVADYRQYIEVLKEYKIIAYIPNQGRKIGERILRGNLSEFSEVKKLVDTLNDEAGCEIFKTCFDIGLHALLGQYFADTVEEMGDLIPDMVLIYECDGMTDRHMMPFSGGSSALEWNEIICWMRNIGSGPLYVIDCGETPWGFPLQLSKKVNKFGSVIKEYFDFQLSQNELIAKYDNIVLFGAGRMFRNYMRNYGENHKPLFTCDNNPNMWGQQAMGIEIKNPEEIKNLPEDCAVFMCNMYYDEISVQLRDMGINNPIERFSDEFLPILGD